MSGLGAIVEATDGSGPLLKLAEARAQALLGAESPSFSLLCLPPDKGSEDALFARLPRFDAVYTCGVLQHLSDHELYELSLIHISEPTRRTPISYAVFCLKKKNYELCIDQEDGGQVQ